jgi:hypothetical protein
MIYYIVKNRMTKFTREQSRQIDQAVKETIVKEIDIPKNTRLYQGNTRLFNKCQDIP